MVTKISKKLDGTCSKADEIEFLDAVVAAAGEGSYLATLFTSEAVAWMKSQIKNDFDCDLFSRWNKEEEAANDWMLRHDLEKGDRILDEEKFKKALDDEKSTVMNLRALLDNVDALYLNSREELSDSFLEQTRLRADLEFNKNLVIALKVKLFDLQNPMVS